MLLSRHQEKRLTFAKKYENWTVQDWSRVIWSDESKIGLFGDNRRQYCWRTPGSALTSAAIKPTVKYQGGSIMIWACITAFGPGYLCRIDGNLNAELYQQILSDELMKTISFYNLQQNDIIFQQDNDSKHTARSTKQWFQDHHITILDNWPPQSPDLNLIEHLWSELKRRLYNLAPKNQEDLWNNIQDIWNSITEADCKKVIQTMPQRIQDVIKAKGGYTKW